MTDVGIEWVTTGIDKVEKLTLSGPNFHYTDDVFAPIGRLQHLHTLDFLHCFYRTTAAGFLTHLSLPCAPSLRRLAYEPCQFHYPVVLISLSETDVANALTPTLPILLLKQLDWVKLNSFAAREENKMWTRIVEARAEQEELLRLDEQNTKAHEREDYSELLAETNKCIEKGICTALVGKAYVKQDYYICNAPDCELRAANHNAICVSCAKTCHSNETSESSQSHNVSRYPTHGFLLCHCPLINPNCKWSKQVKDK